MSNNEEDVKLVVSGHVMKAIAAYLDTCQAGQVYGLIEALKNPELCYVYNTETSSAVNDLEELDQLRKRVKDLREQYEDLDKVRIELISKLVEKDELIGKLQDKLSEDITEE